MSKRALSIILGLVLTSSGAFAKNKDKKDGKKPTEPSPLDRYIMESMAAGRSAEAAHPTGSIWTPQAMLANLGMDLKASRVNDLVTILVSESMSAVATGDVKTARGSSVQAGIQAAGGITRATGPLANLAKTNMQSALQGQGSTSRGATLNTTMSARVTNVLPNGYLVIEGVKRIQVSSENQVITVRGVVRPVDLDTTNSIPSDRIAQMEVQVNGKGVINDSIKRPFFLYRLLLGLLPF